MKYVSCERVRLIIYQVVDTQLCKLRNVSRLYSIFTEFRNFMISRSRVFYGMYFLVKDITLIGDMYQNTEAFCHYS